MTTKTTPEQTVSEKADMAAQPASDPQTAGKDRAVDDPAIGEAKNAVDRSELIARSDELAGQNQFAAAASELMKLLVADPLDAEVIFRLASITAKSGDLSKAIDLLSEIPDDHPEAGLPALGQSAEWCYQLKRYDQAERLYLKVLELAPQAAPALRQLAYILNRQGRRHEAAVYVRQLCQLGDFRQDELHSLISLSDAMYDDPSASESTAAGERLYWPIGPLAEARKRFNDEEFSEAVTLLHESVADGTAPTAAVALYGLAAAEAQDETRFLWWLSRTDDQTQRFSEYWAALGVSMLAEHQYRPAARALAEAIERDPTDLRSMARLRQALLVLKEDQAAEQFIRRWNSIRDSIRVNNRIVATNPPDPNAIAELATMLQALDRPLEAVLWRAVQQHYTQAPTSERIELNEERQRLVAAGKLFPSPRQILCGLEKTRYALPEIDAIRQSAPQIDQPSDQQPTSATFVNIAKNVGLNHTYRVASQPVERGFAVYQILGGGVVVFDYDRDGNSDLYFAQGGSDPPAFQGGQTNQLYRKTGTELVDTTESASAVESQYTIGVTAGDWNQDGFPDLVTTNIGADVLWINNGDGTFSRRRITNLVNKVRVPSSVAMADLTNDGLPDLYQSNYVDDPRMVLKPPTNELGQPILPVLPSKYHSAADRLIESDGTGGFSIREWTSDSAANSTSLGLVITDFDDDPGVEVFVANDMKPNQLWIRTSSQDQEWIDAAPLRGCAFSFTGAATAAMGVAAGDLDQDGTIDLHVTNFEQENVSLFLNHKGVFQDRNIQYQLAEASHDVLGFGTQAIDYDNDGRRDLAVANGHIEDAVENKSPFKQLPQLFCNLDGRFAISDVVDTSNYWDSPHLGRAMATLDFNRDGRQDIVITHIDEPSALLLNQTPSDHHWLQLQLVGTESERDSTGARIRVRFGQRELTDWVIAGDGYLCHNEEVVCFGLGGSSQVDAIEVSWPSGQQQVFQNVESDQRLLLIEGQRDPFALD